MAIEHLCLFQEDSVWRYIDAAHIVTAKFRDKTHKTLTLAGRKRGLSLISKPFPWEHNNR